MQILNLTIIPVVKLVASVKPDLALEIMSKTMFMQLTSEICNNLQNSILYQSITRNRSNACYTKYL